MKIIKFGADWCVACKTLEKTLVKENIKYSDVNIEENQALAAKYNIRSIPQLFVLNDSGEVVSQITGGRLTPNQIEELKKLSGD